MAPISSLLADHVSLGVCSVDRLFLQGYVPRVQSEGLVVRFLWDRGFPIPSPAVLGKIGRAYVDQINAFIASNQIPTVHFTKGDVKEETAQAFRAGRAGGPVRGRDGRDRAGEDVGVAWLAGWRPRQPSAFRLSPPVDLSQQLLLLHPRSRLGPGFIKTVAYAPFSVWVYLNGNEWAKRQAAQQGLEFKPLDNGFAACEDEAALAGICSGLQAADVWAFFERWQTALPSPFSAEDRQRGYRYDLAFRQLEISDHARVRSAGAGRAWFERTLPDQLTLGRPDQVAVVFGRRVSRKTPGRFHTRIITSGVQAAIQVHYRASKVKQYFKEGRALRTETTVNDTHDFGVRRRLTPHNCDALTDIGHRINQRLLDHQLDACQCAPDATTLQRVVLPSITPDGLPAPRTTVQGTQNDGAARLPVQLPAPVRRTDETARCAS